MIKKLKEKIRFLLRKSEKITQTDMVYVAKGSFWLTMGQILSMASSFLLAFCFANLLSRESYGTYQYVLSIFSLLSIFTLQGIKTSYSQSVAQGFEGSLKPAIKTKIKWGLLGAALAFGMAVYYYFKGNSTLAIGFSIVAGFLPFLEPLGIYDPLLSGRKLFKTLAKFSSSEQIIAALSIIIVLIFTRNIFILLLTFFSIHVIIKIIFLSITLKRFPPNNNTDPKMVSYGRYLTYLKIIPLVASELDKILLWHFLGAAQVAIYTFALAPVIQLKDMIGKLKILAMPKISQKSSEELKKILPKKVFRFFLLIIPIYILYVLLIPYAFKLFFPQYLNAIVYSQVLGLIILFVPRSFLAIAFSTHKKKKEVGAQNIVEPTARIIMMIILAPFLGIWGFVLAFLIGQIITFILTARLFQRL